MDCFSERNNIYFKDTFQRGNCSIKKNIIAQGFRQFSYTSCKKKDNFQRERERKSKTLS